MSDQPSFIGVGGAVLIVVGAVGIWLFVTAKPDGPVVVTRTSGIRDPAQCDRLVQLFRRDGIVKGTRVGGRIRVDEKRWAATTEDNRRGLVDYVSCAAFDGRLSAELDSGAAVTVVDAASGTLLARAGSDGMDFTPAP